MDAYRGIVYGLALSLPIDAGIAALIVWIVR